MTIRTLGTLFILAGAMTLRPAVAAAQATHIEQDDPAITYSGNWWTNDGSQNSGGHAKLTNTRGSRASISFNGTGINWIGVADAYAGLATVYLDGAKTIVNSYNPVSKYQAVLYSASNLAPGLHTLSIEITHERAVGTDGSWVWVDGFDIQGTAVQGQVTANTGTIQENNPAMSYTGAWYANLNPGLSGGSAALSTDAGSRATLTFTGTGVSWITEHDPWSGIGRVYIDGTPVATVDNYASSTQLGVVGYSTSGMPAGTHTITIESTGTRNGSAQAAWVWIDAFNVTP
jgi:hypothetical protein